MPTRYTTPTVESIIESSEDELKKPKRKDEDPPRQASHRQPPKRHDSEMRANMGKGRKKQKANNANNTNKQSAISISKDKVVKRDDVETTNDCAEQSKAPGDTAISKDSIVSSSSEDEDQEEGRRSALARARLHPPSMVSTLTSQTNMTNKSSSSSGSNSTVTQLFVGRRTTQGPELEDEDAPLSPAVPDAPNAFSFTDGAAVTQEDSEEDEQEESAPRSRRTVRWPEPKALMETAHEEVTESSGISPTHVSSSSSSFRGDDNPSDHQLEHDTDRSTSPERSDPGYPESPEAPSAVSERVSAKIASQMAAARQRQNSWSSMQQFGTPDMPRGNVPLPYVAPPALNVQPQYQMAQRPLPRAEKLPVTGYELLATQLASFSTTDSDRGPRIRPMYRKFEALNHRLLLHLQDELSELEEQLHRLDHADTQARRMDRYIIPASRRAAEQAGGELQFYRADILGKIGFKLAQYNQALSSFHSTQSLRQPTLEEIDNYRDYLENEQPIAEVETHFLDPEEDLVSISRQERRKRHHHHRRDSFDENSVVSSVVSQSTLSPRPPTQTRTGPTTPVVKEAKPSKRVKHVRHFHPLPIMATAVAVAVLLPIITFLVIRNMIGRIVITILIALSIALGVWQSHLMNSEILLSKESLMCAGIYGGVMVVIAGIMA